MSQISVLPLKISHLIFIKNLMIFGRYGHFCGTTFYYFIFLPVFTSLLFCIVSLLLLSFLTAPLMLYLYFAGHRSNLCIKKRILLAPAALLILCVLKGSQTAGKIMQIKHTNENNAYKHTSSHITSINRFHFLF